MTFRVPYIADETIERDAEALLAQYAHAKGVKIKAPIRIEDIVEKLLKLRMEFNDLRRLLGLPGGTKPDIFGAIWLESGEIVIDESLDPEEHPLKEERYRYTLAHEVGHWRLHRPLVQANSRQETKRPTVVCRSSQENERVELQANRYASCLLMPRNLVMEAWRDKFGNDHPYMLRRKARIVVPGEIGGQIAAVLRSFEDREELDHFARPFAERFLVSPPAMRIRLEKLGLLQREAPMQQSLLGCRLKQAKNENRQEEPALAYAAAIKDMKALLHNA